MQLSSQVMSNPDLLKKVVALCKRRGFVYPGSEIYGGFANTYSYGPLGAELKKNIKDLWWNRFVRSRTDMQGLDGPILLHPKVWNASGHVAGFSDALIDCKACKCRFRVDPLIEAATGQGVEGLNLTELDQIIQKNKIPCPKCKSFDWTPSRNFNLMFSTHLSKTQQDGDDIAYLRPETAQAIFVDFQNIVDTMRVQVPFGIGQIGKAFRNEITPGNFLFRVIEFEQMEIEYFIKGEEWEQYFDSWLKEMWAWCDLIGLPRGNLSLYEHPKEKLSHYSKRTVDILYQFPFGLQELYGLAYRTDFDLSKHSEASGKSLEYRDPHTNQKYIPHVIEPTFGVDRTFLALLCEAYEEQDLGEGDIRTVLHLKPNVAPIKVAVFPLMKKEPLANLAKEIYQSLQTHFYCQYDEGGAIGKRYRRQDEIGTPLCITIDFESLEDGTVTIRHRDSMQQERISKDKLLARIFEVLHA